MGTLGNFEQVLIADGVPVLNGKYPMTCAITNKARSAVIPYTIEGQPTKDIDMTFIERLRVAKTFIGARVKITDQRSYGYDEPETGICIDVVKFPDVDQVDFVLEDNSRYGMILEDVNHDRCSGDAGALGRFIRTVERLS